MGGQLERINPTQVPFKKLLMDKSMSTDKNLILCHNAAACHNEVESNHGWNNTTIKRAGLYKVVVVPMPTTWDVSTE
jgi:hypothetical protein